jgi:adenylate kinase family enzyme
VRPIPSGIRHSDEREEREAERLGLRREHGPLVVQPEWRRVSDNRRVRLLVLGAPASGKTTVAASLRAAVPALEVWDTDDEILRLNNNIWPSIEDKNRELLPKIVDAAAQQHQIILLNSYMPVELALNLKQVGFRIVLLEVAEEELRRRHTKRAVEEGWSNEEWFEWHQSAIKELRDRGLIDHVVSGEQTVDAITTCLLELQRAKSASE